MNFEKRSAYRITIALVVITFAISIFTNVVTDILPGWLEPYLGFAWPILIILVIISIILERKNFFNQADYESPLPLELSSLETSVTDLDDVKLENYKPIKQISEWLWYKLQTNFSSRRKVYLENLTYLHRNFDVKGLTTQNIFNLELKRVFVDLSIIPQSLNKLSVDPTRRLQPEQLNRERHGIWHYLKSEVLKNQNFAIIGAPGSGKTTLLKHLAITLATENSFSSSIKLPDKLPVLIFLRNVSKALKINPNYSLLSATCDSMSSTDFKADSNWFRAYFEKGYCLVMLDGLDEVAELESRKKVVKWVESQMTIFNKNLFLVTSRPFGYISNPLSQVTVLEIRPFTDDQVKKFIDNWYLANEIYSSQKDDPGVHLIAREDAKDLLMRLNRTPALLELTGNPLLLTMIATVHRYRSSLPGRRVELYGEISEVFLGKRQQARGITSQFSPLQKQRVLQPLAYYMMCNEIRDISLEKALEIIIEPLERVNPESSPVEFLEMIENGSGLFLERESGLYHFAHLTFQEYLAAVHVLEQQLENELVQQIENSWWHEVIRLYVAQSDATLVIQACLEFDELSLPVLSLAIECLEEAREVQPTLRYRLEKLIEQGVEDKNREWRKIVTEALLTLRLRRRMVAVNQEKVEGIYIDKSPITQAEYQLFLDEQQAFGDDYRPAQWMDYQFQSGNGDKPIVGIGCADAIEFCKWLTNRESEQWVYRIPLYDELDVNELDDEALYWLEEGGRYWIESRNKKLECKIGNDSIQLVEYQNFKHQLNIDLLFAKKLETNLQSHLKIAQTLALDRQLPELLRQTLIINRQLTTIFQFVNHLRRIIGQELPKVDSLKKNLEKKIVEMPESKNLLEQKITFHLETITNIETRISTVSSQKAILKDEVASKKKELDSIRRQLNNVLEERESVVRKETSKRELDVRKRLNEVEQKSFDLKQRILNSQAQQQEYELIIPRLEANLERIQVVQDAVDRMNSFVRIIRKRTFLLRKTIEMKELESLTVQINRDQKRLKELNWEDELKLERELKQVNDEIGYLNKEVRELTDWEARSAKLLKKQNGLEEELEVASQALKSLQIEEEKADQIQKTLSVQLDKTYEEKHNLEQKLKPLLKIYRSTNVVGIVLKSFFKVNEQLHEENFLKSLNNAQNHTIDHVKNLECVLLVLRNVHIELRAAVNELDLANTHFSRNEFDEFRKVIEGVRVAKNLAQAEFEQISKKLHEVINQIKIFDLIFEEATKKFDALDIDHIVCNVSKNIYSDPISEYLQRVLKRYKELTKSPNVNKDHIDTTLDFLRRLIRLCAFILISKSFMKKPIPLQEFEQALRDTIEHENNISQSLVDLYMGFVVLEQRIHGAVPAYEGIWVVKERAQRSY